MRARPAGLIALWVAVTAVLTTTAFLAVEVVADEVGGGTTQVLSASAVDHAAQDASADSSPSPTPSPSSTHHASPSSSPKPSSSPHSSPSPDRSSSPQPTKSSGSGGNGGSGGGAGGGSGGGSGSAVSKTFAVQGGTVAASCTGSAVALKSAQPKDGWRVEVKDRGPEELEVTFRSGEQETEARVRCSGGVPVLHSGSDDGATDD